MTNRKPTKRDHFNALLAINEVASNPALVEFIEHELDLLNRKNTAERKPTAKQVENADLVAFIEHEIELLDKKNSAERKPTAKQIENEGYKSEILAWIEPDVLYASADVAKNCPACAELSPQRVSALLGQLVESGKLTKTTEKRKNFYSLA